MKRFTAFLLAILMLIPATGLTETAIEAETELVEVIIKGHRFGDSKESVIEAEGEPDGTGVMSGNIADFIYYSNASVVGFDTTLVYYFTENRLCEVRYILQEEHSNDSLYIDDYKKIEEAITSKYGKPLAFISGEKWDTARHKEYYKDDKGNALSFGYLSFETYYLVKDAEIVMHMLADNYRVSTTISYVSSVITKPEPNYDDEI